MLSKTSKFSAVCVITALLSGFVAGHAKAEQMDYQAATAKSWYELSEIGLGAGATDFDTGTETSANINGRVLMQPIGNMTWPEILRVRPEIGTSLNLEGKTTFGYAGVNFDLLNFDKFFLDGTFDMAIHTGPLNPQYAGDNSRKFLGSRLEFHESAEFGYQLTRQYAVSTFIDHISNAGIMAKRNPGEETIGLRFSYLFQ